ncbi:MAG: glycosyltransferase family 2 protein [Kiritimatiellae bacterium]|nr:glycosyltransferase family 2 protein [Kiritimatiellia bacterium]
MRAKVPKLILVVPCYNEEETLPLSSPLFAEELNSLVDSGRVSPESRILFVDDGSKDETWRVISDLDKGNPRFIGIRQSRNRGHQFALWAGLMEARNLGCDVTVTIDCDGQDDVHAMTEMVDEYAKGSEIVYGVRNDRSSDTFFKRFTAECFYRIQAALGVEAVYNHADYRLLSARVLDALSEYGETNLYLRGMIPLVGFNSSKVFYARKERLAGKSHYPFLKMLGFAADGITSLSVKPIRLITLFGAIVSLLTFIMAIWSLVSWMRGDVVRGWTSEVLCVCFLGGIQLVSLGVIGEYVGKIYLETKRRPRAIISDRTWQKTKEGNP